MASLKALLLSWFFSVDAQAVKPVTQISLLDAQFKTVKVLTTATELDAFAALWNRKKVVNSNGKPSWTHKLDIVTEKKSQRWLYSVAGSARVLAMGSTPLYEIDDAAALNKLLGIE